MKLLNAYEPGMKYENFPNLENQLLEYYDILLDSSEANLSSITPRGLYSYRIGFRDIVYYISTLYDNSSNTIIDVGCGDSIWKLWFPNIYGIDIIPPIFLPTIAPGPDAIESFTNKFVKDNYEKFDAGMALNSIHFTSWKNIDKNIEDCMALVKPNGKFLFTINFAMLDRFSTLAKHTIKGTYAEKVEAVYDIVSTSKYNLCMFDAKDTLFPRVNGHARFILQKNN